MSGRINPNFRFGGGPGLARYKTKIEMMGAMHVKQLAYLMDVIRRNLVRGNLPQLNLAEQEKMILDVSALMRVGTWRAHNVELFFRDPTPPFPSCQDGKSLYLRIRIVPGKEVHDFVMRIYKEGF